MLKFCRVWVDKVGMNITETTAREVMNQALEIDISQGECLTWSRVGANYRSRNGEWISIHTDAQGWCAKRKSDGTTIVDAPTFDSIKTCVDVVRKLEKVR